MSSNDYFNTHPQQQPPQQQQQQQPYYQNYDGPAPSLPAYQSQAPSLHQTPSLHPSQRSHTVEPVSPFETPFDDHVHPAGAHRMDSQNSLGSQDTRYYGNQGRPQDSQGSFADNIPMRDHPGKLGMNDSSTDHVYDAPAPPPGMVEEGRSRSNRRQSRLGFVKAPKKKIAWVVYTLTIIQIAVFIAEIAKNATLTGSPIETKPSFNPMIGPSPWVLINMGARYVPCMHNVVGIQDSNVTISWGCPNTTSLTADQDCTLQQLCGFTSSYPVPIPVVGGGIDQKPEPNQWFRFIVPIFLHAGIVHIGFNMLLQMTLGVEMERSIGPIRFFLVYFSSGIFGFVLGGNYAAAGIASTGASGSLFGILALNLLDLLYTWKERVSPWKDFTFIALDVVISFVLGLLPGLDNFSHIGGFLMGIVLGICIVHSPNSLRKRIGMEEPPYAPVQTENGDVKPGVQGTGVQGFFKSPVGFFKGRKPAWWAWWIIRAASLVAVFIVFILLLNNFYVYRKTCSWCKYLSCININNWCEIGDITLTNS